MKMNTKKTSACSMLSTVPSPANFQNRFGSLMVTEESSIENESQVQTENNHHHGIKIQNKINIKSWKKQIPNYAVYGINNKNYNNVKVENLVVTAPANKSYSRTTKYGKKRYVVVHNHITQI